MGAMKQGARGMQRIAAAGSHGHNPQNLQRSLISFFGMPPGAPDFDWFDIPTKSGVHPHPFFLPHAWLSSLFHHHPAVWESAILGGSGGCSIVLAEYGRFPHREQTSFLISCRQASHITIGDPRRWGNFFETRLPFRVHLQLADRCGGDISEYIPHDHHQEERARA